MGLNSVLVSISASQSHRKSTPNDTMFHHCFELFSRREEHMCGGITGWYSIVYHYPSHRGAHHSGLAFGTERECQMS